MVGAAFSREIASRCIKSVWNGYEVKGVKAEKITVMINIGGLDHQ
jgi:hypothetical protein